VRFVRGTGDIAQLKPSSKVLTVSIGPGLPKDSRPGRKPVVSSKNGGMKQTRPVGPPAPQGVVSSRGAPGRPAPGRPAPSHPTSAAPSSAPPPPVSLPPSRKLAKRQSSKDLQDNMLKAKQSGNRTPTLPKETESPAKQMAAAMRANNNNNNKFMMTPDAGVAGAQRQSLLRPAPAGGRPRPTLKSKPTVQLPQCRCLYPYDAQDTDELSFNEGDIIDVISEEPSGWWRGRIRGKEGVFPANYAQKI
jgi:myosin-1